MNLSTVIAPLRKAVVASAGAGLFALIGSLAAGLTDGHLSGAEIGVACGIGLAAAAATGKATFETQNHD